MSWTMLIAGTAALVLVLLGIILGFERLRIMMLGDGYDENAPRVKNAAYALLISPGHENRTAILEEKIQATIRAGWRDYRPGASVLLGCHIEPWAVLAEITAVRHCLAKEVSAEEYDNAGYGSLAEMIDDLQNIYPFISLDAPVTIISWDHAKGFLVNHAAEYREDPEKLYQSINIKKS